MSNNINNTIIKSTPIVTKTNTDTTVKTSTGFYSESLQKYIERAYKKCKTEEDIKKCKISLMKIIQNALKKGDLHTRDFNKFPLPVLPSDKPDEIKGIIYI